MAKRKDEESDDGSVIDIEHARRIGALDEQSATENERGDSAVAAKREGKRVPWNLQDWQKYNLCMEAYGSSQKVQIVQIAPSQSYIDTVPISVVPQYDALMRMFRSKYWDGSDMTIAWTILDRGRTRAQGTEHLLEDDKVRRAYQARKDDPLGVQHNQFPQHPQHQQQMSPGYWERPPWWEEREPAPVPAPASPPVVVPSSPQEDPRVGVLTNQVAWLQSELTRQQEEKQRMMIDMRKRERAAVSQPGPPMADPPMPQPVSPIAVQAPEVQSVMPPEIQSMLAKLGAIEDRLTRSVQPPQTQQETTALTPAPAPVEMPDVRRMGHGYPFQMPDGSHWWMGIDGKPVPIPVQAPPPNPQPQLHQMAQPQPAESRDPLHMVREAFSMVREMRSMLETFQPSPAIADPPNPTPPSMSASALTTVASAESLANPGPGPKRFDYLETDGWRQPINPVTGEPLNWFTTLMANLDHLTDAFKVVSEATVKMGNGNGEQDRVGALHDEIRQMRQAIVQMQHAASLAHPAYQPHALPPQPQQPQPMHAAPPLRQTPQVPSKPPATPEPEPVSAAVSSNEETASTTHTRSAWLSMLR